MEPSPNFRQGGPSSIEQVSLILLGSKEGGASISRKGGKQNQWTNKASWLSQLLAGWWQIDMGEPQTIRMQAGIKHNRETMWKPSENLRVAELLDCCLSFLSKARFWERNGLGFPMKSFLSLTQRVLLPQQWYCENQVCPAQAQTCTTEVPQIMNLGSVSLIRSF